MRKGLWLPVYHQTPASWRRSRYRQVGRAQPKPATAYENQENNNASKIRAWVENTPVVDSLDRLQHAMPHFLYSLCNLPSSPNAPQLCPGRARFTYVFLAIGHLPPMDAPR